MHYQNRGCPNLAKFFVSAWSASELHNTICYGSSNPVQLASSHRQHLCLLVGLLATLKSSFVISWSVTTYSGLIERCCNALQAYLYVAWYFQASESNLWMLSHALCVIHWLFTLCKWRIPRSHFTWLSVRSYFASKQRCNFCNSTSTIAINSMDNHSISPGANEKGKVTCSFAGTSHLSG